MTGLPVSDCQYSEQHKNPGEPVCTTRMLNQGCPCDVGGGITCDNYIAVNREMVIVERPEQSVSRIKPGTTLVQYGMRLANRNDMFEGEIEDLWIYNFAGIRQLWLVQLTWAELNKIAQAVYQAEHFPPEFLALIDLQMQLKGDIDV